VRPALATTGGPLMLISSPYSKRGELFGLWKRHYGPLGDPLILVAQGASRTFNPSLPQSVVDRAMARDPASARAEYLAEFRSDVGQFVDRDVITANVMSGIRELMPAAATSPVATVSGPSRAASWSAPARLEMPSKASSRCRATATPPSWAGLSIMRAPPGGAVPGIGAAWVYTRSGGVWTQQGNKLVGTGAVGPAEQGFSVALSADGNTAIVGGPGDNAEYGAAWVYTRSNGVWTQQGGKLVGTGAVGPAEQGFSVALSADGYTAIVGGIGDNSYTGAAWVFVQPSLQVTPATNMVAAGNPGGPFGPSSFQYQLSATVGSINYSISGLPNWLTPSSTSGTASTGTTVTFTVNADAKRHQRCRFRATGRPIRADIVPLRTQRVVRGREIFDHHA
jgi:hypothetical protein